MRRNTKNITIVILSLALVVSSIGNIGLSLSNNKNPDVPGEVKTLRAGTHNRPYDLDPVLSYDSVSNDVIVQTCEGLYQYNLSDPNLGIIPMLAKDYGMWDVTGTLFTIPLRRNVFFHDGTPFNAEAVKWNFERINFFINGTGTLNATIGVSQIHHLFEFPNGTTIFDPVSPVTINSDYSVTINLRAPFAVFESLLCYVTASMLSPSSTPKYEYIDTLNGKIVGTGPFVYDYYTADIEIKFHRWERYWRTGTYFEELIISLYDSSVAINNDLLDYSLDYSLGSRSLFCAFCALPIITHPVESFDYYYLGMNNNKINKTWRQAISYAINYTYIIEEIRDWTAFRSNGPLAPNFPMYDPTIKAATWNLAKARQILVDAGITNLTANNDTTGPVADAWREADFKLWEFFERCGSSFSIDMYLLLYENLDLIGIELEEVNDCSFIFSFLDDYEMLELFFIGYRPDYLSPYNMIATLFSNNSISNAAQYHNHTVEMWLEEVLSEANATKRAELYSRILHQIVEVDMPHAFGYHPYEFCTHSDDLKNVPYNSLMRFYAYPICRNATSG